MYYNKSIFPREDFFYGALTNHKLYKNSSVTLFALAIYFMHFKGSIRMPELLNHQVFWLLKPLLPAPLLFSFIGPPRIKNTLMIFQFEYNNFSQENVIMLWLIHCWQALEILSSISVFGTIFLHIMVVVYETR